MNLLDFFLNLGPTLIGLLVGQRVFVAYKKRGRREKQLAAEELEKEVRKSLDSFGLGISTLGLSVVLNNRTEINLRVRRVELSSADGCQVIRLLHDPDSHDLLANELVDDRTIVELKFPSSVGLSQEFGEVASGARADWVLACRLHNLVEFNPTKVSFVVEYNDGINAARVIEHEAAGSMSVSIPYYIDAWRKKCKELSK